MTTEREKEILEYLIPIKRSNSIEHIRVDDIVLVRGIDQPDFEMNFRGFTVNNLAVIYSKKYGQTAIDKSLLTLKNSRIIEGNIECIEYAIENDLYSKWIEEGLITEEQAKEIIESIN